MTVYDIFYSLLRFSLGIDKEFPCSPSEEQWQEALEISRKQGLSGITYEGIRMLPGDVLPHRNTFLGQLKTAEKIHGMNTFLVEKSAYYTDLFSRLGRKSVILKGQGNARMYPEPLSRCPGDIDIWVEGGRKSVLALLRDNNLLGRRYKVAYHHVSLPRGENKLSVEVHFRPSSGNLNPLTNHMLQKYLERKIVDSTLCEDGYYVPTPAFNLPMQLSHIQRHFLMEGIGLRQIVDYYYLLHASTEEDMKEFLAIVPRLGLGNILSALLWVLKEVLHLEDKYVILPPDETLGRILLGRIEKGGNFGAFSKTRSMDDAQYFKSSFKKRWLLIRKFPGEAIWGEIRHVWFVLTTIPTRIRKGSLTLRRRTEENR